MPKADDAGADSIPTILWMGMAVDIRSVGEERERLAPIYAVINGLQAQLANAPAASAEELGRDDVVIANYCGGTPATVALLKGYIAGGGSLVVMGDNFCVGVNGLNEGPYLSSAEWASKVTCDWGIEFTEDDDAQIQLFQPVLDHPLTSGVQHVYSFRHAYLSVGEPAQTVFAQAGKSFLALYDGIGTIVAIPETGFHELRDGDPFPPAPANDNFVLWHNMLRWLIEQSRVKRAALPDRPTPTLGGRIGCPPTPIQTPAENVPH